MGVYAQLRQLRSSDQWANAENVVWKRDAATFTLESGSLRFAAPVGGRIFAASFDGQGTIRFEPPSAIDRGQISRFTKAPNLVDTFRKAVFFFTDDSLEQILTQLNMQTGAPPGTDAIAAAQKNFIEKNNEWWSNARQGNFEMRNMAARMLADLTDPSSKGFFLADFKGDRAGDLIFHVSWNRDPLLLPGFNNDEEVMLLHYNRDNWHEWWAGFHLADEYAKSPRPEHRTLLARCPRQVIEARVADNNRLNATSVLDYEIIQGTPRVLPFNLRGVLRISTIHDAEGSLLKFIQEARELDNDPWVILPAAVQKGATGKLKITYAEDSNRDSRIVHQRGSGLFYVTARDSWYPNFGAFDDRTLFTLRFRSPKKYTFVATGRRVFGEKEKREFVSEWESDIPFAAAGFNYGHFAQKSRSDSALTVTAYSGKEIPNELKAIQSAIRMAELAGEEYHAAELGIAPGGFNTSRLVGHAADVSFGAFKLFQYYFGPMPLKTVSVTQQPVGNYGQSWPTLIYLPYTSFLDSTTRHMLRMDLSPDTVEFFNTVAPHEMAHQWFGHLVGWKTYHDVWLSEGISEFAAALWLSKAEPKKIRNFWDLKRKRILKGNSQGHRPTDVGPLWLSFQLPAYLEGQLYQELVYFKGAYVIEMLRMMMMDPSQREPDARFITMMRDFVSTYGGKLASTEDFRRVVEKHMREPMDWFFNQWVYGTEIPSYKLKYGLKDAGGGKTLLQISVTQSGVSKDFRMKVPVYAVKDKSTRRLGLLKIVGPMTFSAEVTLPQRPDKIVLDATHSILCESRE